jgi:hypothetical protein
MRRWIDALLVPVVLALRDAEGADRLAAAVAQAQAGALEAAAETFSDLAQDPDRRLSIPATFDLARARFERSVRRTLPAPPAKREKPATVADARALLGRMRDELEAARSELLRVLDDDSHDEEALVSCAAVVDRLRAVAARDAEWAAAAEASLRRGGANGPLKPGPSAARAASGAPGEKGGAATGADDPNQPPPGDAVAAGTAPPREELLQAVRTRLEQALADRDAEERRRADDQRRRAPEPRQ